MSFGKAARHARGLDLARIKKVIVTFWSYDTNTSAVRSVNAFPYCMCPYDHNLHTLYHNSVGVCVLHCCYREVYRALSRDGLKESNPKCSVIANVVSTPIDPQVEVTFGKL